MYVLERKYYTLDASNRTITFLNSYADINIERFISILDITSNDIIYDVDIKRDCVSLADGVMTYSCDNNVASDDDVLRILLNTETKAKVIAESEEHEHIDAGNYFRNALKFDILDAGTHYVLIRTGTKEVHITLGADTDGDLQILLSEEPTITTDGTEEPAGNFNFVIDTDPLTKLFNNPIYTSIGTYKANTWTFGGNGANPAQATHATASLNAGYVVFKPSTDYIISFVNSADRDIQVFFQMDFYEKETLL
jgi:hypothetical protein